MVAKSILTWFVLYPTAGYNEVTLNGTQAVTLILGVLFVAIYRLGWRQVGLSLRSLRQGAAALAAAYAVLLAAVVVPRLAGGDLAIIREGYSAYAIFNNWVLTGLAEELIFAGVIFTLIMQGWTSADRDGWTGFRRNAAIIVLVAALFALWHLPGYVAVAVRSQGISAAMLGNLALPFASWLFFGTIYLLSRNLWLTAFIHASTDYALLPAIVDRPALGLLFMATGVFAAWVLGRRHRRHPERPPEGSEAPA